MSFLLPQILTRTSVLRPAQAACLVAGVAALVWPFLGGQFRQPDGSLAASACIPLAGGLSLAILGWGMAGQFRGFCFWAAIAIFGQAVSLQLIEAGPYVRYQHFKPFLNQLTGTGSALLGLAALQCGLVLWQAIARRRAITSWLNNVAVESWRLIGAGVASVAFAAALSRDPRIFVADLAISALLQVVNLGAVVLAVCSLPRQALAWRPLLFKSPTVATIVEKVGPIDRLVVGAAVAAATVALVLNFVVYERFPHLQDEVLYLYQARYFATGTVAVAAPPVPDAFSIYMIPSRSDTWYSPFPPGWPALLALGVLIGAPWLVNPLLTGVNVLLSFALLRELYDRRTARVASLLLSVSPWFLFMGMSFMSHNWTLACSLVAAFSIARSRRNKSWTWALLAGAAVGMVSLIRPMDGLIVAGLLGLWALGFGGRRLPVRSISAYLVGVAIVGGIALPYNQAITGSPIVQPLEAYYEEYFGHNSNALGFGPERGFGWPLDPFPGHSPLESAINAHLNGFALNVELFGWATGSLLFVALLLLTGRLADGDRLMLAVIVANLGMYSLYWFNGGPDFGARYWYLTIVPLVALTARGVQHFARVIDAGSRESGLGTSRAAAALLLLCSASILTFLPWRAMDKYHGYLGMRPQIPVLAEKHNFGRSLVLVRGDELPGYTSAWAYNPLDVDASVPLYAWDRNPESEVALIEAFSDRPIWILAGPSLTSDHFEVIRGPLSPGSLTGRGAQSPSSLQVP